MKPHPLDVQMIDQDTFRAHIFLNGQHHYGEAHSIGSALMELGHYLDSLAEPKDKDLPLLMDLMVENKP